MWRKEVGDRFLDLGSFSIIDENLAFQFAKVFEEAFEKLDAVVDVINSTTLSDAMHTKLRITQILLKLVVVLRSGFE